MNKKRILVVEDHPDDQDSYRRYLEGLDYDVNLASSSSEAQGKLSTAKKNEYFAWIIDISLTPSGTDHEGLDLLIALRARGWPTPCVILSNNLNKAILLDLLTKYEQVTAVDKSDFADHPHVLQETLAKIPESRGDKTDSGSGSTLSAILLIIVATIALLAVLAGTAWSFSLMSQQPVTTALTIILLVSAVMLFYVVIMLFVALLTGKLNNKSATQMLKYVLEKVPGLESVLKVF